MSVLRLPNHNELGLALPPSDEDLAPVESHLKTWQMRENHGTDHHLYWPGKFYFQAGANAYAFRKHRLNIIKGVDREAHYNVHWRYDRYVSENPGCLMPSEPLMLNFMRDATLIDLMWSYVGSARDLSGNLDHWAQKPEDAWAKQAKLLAMVGQCAEYAMESTVLPIELVELQIAAANAATQSSAAQLGEAN